jgi:hypothetical protein
MPDSARGCTALMEAQVSCTGALFSRKYMERGPLVGETYLPAVRSQTQRSTDAVNPLPKVWRALRYLIRLNRDATAAQRWTVRCWTIRWRAIALDRLQLLDLNNENSIEPS